MFPLNNEYENNYIQVLVTYFIAGANKTERKSNTK